MRAFSCHKCGFFQIPFNSPLQSFADHQWPSLSTQIYTRTTHTLACDASMQSATYASTYKGIFTWQNVSMHGNAALCTVHGMHFCDCHQTRDPLLFRMQRGFRAQLETYLSFVRPSNPFFFFYSSICSTGTRTWRQNDFFVFLSFCSSASRFDTKNPCLSIHELEIFGKYFRISMAFIQIKKSNIE